MLHRLCLLPAEPPWRWPVWKCNCASCLLLAHRSVWSVAAHLNYFKAFKVRFEPCWLQRWRTAFSLKANILRFQLAFHCFHVTTKRAEASFCREVHIFHPPASCWRANVWGTLTKTRAIHIFPAVVVSHLIWWKTLERMCTWLCEKYLCFKHIILHIHSQWH